MARCFSLSPVRTSDKTRFAAPGRPRTWELVGSSMSSLPDLSRLAARTGGNGQGRPSDLLYEAGGEDPRREIEDDVLSQAQSKVIVDVYGPNAARRTSLRDWWRGPKTVEGIFVEPPELVRETLRRNKFAVRFTVLSHEGHAPEPSVALVATNVARLVQDMPEMVKTAYVQAFKDEVKYDRALADEGEPDTINLFVQSPTLTVDGKGIDFEIRAEAFSFDGRGKNPMVEQGSEGFMVRKLATAIHRYLRTKGDLYHNEYVASDDLTPYKQRAHDGGYILNRPNADPGLEFDVVREDLGLQNFVRRPTDGKEFLVLVRADRLYVMPWTHLRFQMRLLPLGMLRLVNQAFRRRVDKGP